METLLAIKEADLSRIFNELVKLRAEVERIKNPVELHSLGKKQICKMMEWSDSTFEVMRRNETLPMPTYKMGGVKVDYSDFMEWKAKWKELEKQGKI